MWQVHFYIAMEQEHARQVERDRQHRLVVEEAAAARPGRVRRLVDTTDRTVRSAARYLGSALGRPAIGPHHL